MISLLLLPFAFIEYADTQVKAELVTGLRITMTDTNFHKNQVAQILNEKFEFPPKRNYLDILFTGNNKFNKIKSDFAQIRIREIIFENDSINGIHFKFEDSCEFWAFVKVIDILKQESATTFIFLDNNIWFLHYSPDTTITNLICGTEDIIIVAEPAVLYWEETLNWIKLSWRNSWELITAFTVFIAMTAILQRRKRITI